MHFILKIYIRQFLFFKRINFIDKNFQLHLQSKYYMYVVSHHVAV